MKQLLSLYLIFVVACGTTAPQDMPDAAVPPMLDDAGHVILDAAVTPGRVNVPVTCEPFVRTVVHSATDGSKDVTTATWAIVPSIHASQTVIVHICDTFSPVIQCIGGDTCSGNQAPSGTQACVISPGVFIDDKLSIQCSLKTERFGASGTLLSSQVILDHTITVELVSQ